jgi:hypothetical protein
LVNGLMSESTTTVSKFDNGVRQIATATFEQQVTCRRRQQQQQ